MKRKLLPACLFCLGPVALPAQGAREVVKEQRVSVALTSRLTAAGTACRAQGTEATASTLSAWGRVRAALASAQLTAERGDLRTTTLSYERRETLDGVTARQSGAVFTGAASQPWRSVSADSLRRFGYVTTEPGTENRIFHGPDVRVLGSEAFMDDHCFRIVGTGDSTRIGIAFEPTPERRNMPGIAGTVWLDRATSELRDMEWRYLNVARNVDENTTGGSMHFVRLRNGAWVISRWEIRMPLVEMAPSGSSMAVVFRGTKRVGGELVTAMTGSGQDTLWAGPKLTMHGIAFDSLVRRPMTSALVGIAGTNRTTITDSAGRFAFANLAPGVYRLITQHDALEAIGLAYQTTTAVLTSMADTLRVSMPPFETLWRIACESAPPGPDTALVYGTIRRAGHAQPVAGASVIATWVDIVASGKRDVGTRRRNLDARTDSAGSYALCGVPTQTGVRMRAVADSAGSGTIDIGPLADRLMERRDFTVSDDPVARGIVVGTVVGPNAAPVGGARVLAAGVREVRTDPQGRFVLREVPLGTQQIEVLAVGHQPVSRAVDVSRLDTARVEVLVTAIPVVLQRVNVVAASVRRQFMSDFNARREKGGGHFRDSTTIGVHGTLGTVFAQMPGVRVVRGKVFLPRPVGECEPIVWIDNVHVKTIDDLMALRPGDLAAVELYPRELGTPVQFVVRDLRTNPCGTIVAWTKWFWEGFRGQVPPG